MKIRAFRKPNHKTALIVGGFAAAIVILANVPAALALIGNQHGGSPAANGGGGHLLRQPAAVTNGLVGWWKLDDNAASSTVADAMGANNGTLYSGASPINTSSKSVAGKYGTALGFSGNNYVKIANSNNFNFTGSNTITLSSWFKYSGTDGSLIDRGGVCVTYGYFNLTIQNGKLHTMFNNANNSGGQKILTGSTSLTAGQWYYAVSVLNGTAITLYLNGVQDNTGNIFSGTLWNDNSSIFDIGATANTCPSPASNYFTGSIDDVRVYNRALTAIEISQLYKGSSPTNCDQTCVGYWKFDEGGSVTTTADSSGNGNTGTLMNSASNSPAANGTSNGPLWTGGVFGNGLKFDGVDDYVEVPDNSSLDFPSGGNFTVSAWVDPLDFNGRWGNLIVSKRSTGQNCMNYLLSIGNTGIASFSIQNFNQASSGLNSNNALGTNSWVQLTGVVGGGTMYFYVNGIKQSGTATVPTGNIVGTGMPLRFAQNHDLNSATHVMLDDVRIYSRALAPYEIYDQYLAGR